MTPDHLQVQCVRTNYVPTDPTVTFRPQTNEPNNSVQVNIPAESGEMGVLANHVPSIEQLKPGLVEIMEENGGSKQFFRTSDAQYQISCDHHN